MLTIHIAIPCPAKSRPHTGATDDAGAPRKTRTQRDAGVHANAVLAFEYRTITFYLQLPQQLSTLLPSTISREARRRWRWADKISVQHLVDDKEGSCTREHNDPVECRMGCHAVRMVHDRRPR